MVEFGHPAAREGKSGGGDGLVYGVISDEDHEEPGDGDDGQQDNCEPMLRGCSGG